jgi:zinc-binding alcohol dehydrogenase/oxidoreductase
MRHGSSGFSPLRSRVVRAVRIHEDGGPEVLRVEEAPDPEPGPGEVLVRLGAASLNHLDLWLRQGLPSVPKPRILGADGAGVVAALGEGAAEFSVGDEVLLNPGLDDGARIVGEHMDGTHAELIAVPAEYLHPLPPSLSVEEAAAFPLVFATAYRMLATRAAVQEGEWVLVWGVGSGVGTAALAVGKALGARVAVTSRDEGKLARARELGADAAIRTDADIVEELRALTDGRGVDVVVEHIGEATWKTSLQAVRKGGRICVCGATSGPNPPANLHRIFWKQLSILGSTMGTRADFAAVYDLVASGKAKPIVDRVFPLEEVAEAHRYLEEGRQLGKVVLRIAPAGAGAQ